MSQLQKHYHCIVPENWKDVFAEETLRQIEKDFALQGVPLKLNVDQLHYRELIKKLAGTLESMTFLNNRSLSRVLYQTDVNEEELLFSLSRVEPADIYLFLADRILRRCFEKVYWRYKRKA